MRHSSRNRIAYWIGVGFIAAFWLVPIFYTAVTTLGAPWCPKYVQNLHRIACLFEHRITGWNAYYFQVRLSGESFWREFDEENLSQMVLFGQQTRLQMLLDDCQMTQREPEVLNDLVKFVRVQCESDLKFGIRVGAVRVLRARLPVGGNLAKPKSKWRKPKLAEISSESLEQLIYADNFRD